MLTLKKYFMRNIIFSSLSVIIMLGVAECKKPPPVPDEPLKISSDASSFTTSPAADFRFILKVESAMPANGVRIEYNVKGEVDNQNYPQGAPINTSNNIIPITIGILPRQKICICTVTVTSKTRSTNTATTSFRVVYK
jgi:hypothetical protein